MSKIEGLTRDDLAKNKGEVESWLFIYYPYVIFKYLN